MRRTCDPRAPDDAPFGVADLARFVNLSVCQTHIRGLWSNLLVWKVAHPITAMPLNLAPLLRRVVLVGESPRRTKTPPSLKN